MPTLVISAVNIVEGGMLKILHDCLNTVRRDLPDWRIVALVNNEGVVTTPGVELIAIPHAKTSWLRRIHTEYFGLRDLSRTLKADIWWSLHDMSPVVDAGSQFVYCHNSLPFYRLSAREAWLEPGLIVFNALYSLFYRINIHANRAVIVQQQWMREQFEQRYGIRDIIVAHPVAENLSSLVNQPIDNRKICTFVYPSLSRAFKNFEIIGDAARLLAEDPAWQGQILLTISPDESRLTRHLYERYGDVRGLEFIGRQTRAQMTELYQRMDCLLFPSRLETWGLPISEAKAMGKPMILADLPYARETAGTYDRVHFVPPNSAQQMADLMLDAHVRGWRPCPTAAAPIAQPFVENWSALVATIVDMHGIEQIAKPSVAAAVAP